MTQIISFRKQPSAFAVGARFCFCILILSGCLMPRVYGQTARLQSSGGAPPTSSSQHQGHDHTPQAAAAHPLHTHELMKAREMTTIAIPDLMMTDQDGRRVKLYDGLMKDKLVVLNFFYTTCQGTCSTAGLWFSKLQDKLGKRLGKEIILISISLDPEVDTPEKIRQWVSHFRRKPGWTLLTSKEEAARKLFSKLSADVLKDMHSPVVFVGDGRRNPVGWISVDIIDESRALLDYFDQMKGR